MQYGDEIAVTDSEKKITYLELNQKAICIGQYFMEKGICKDDKVLVQMPNRISFVAVLFALAKITSSNPSRLTGSVAAATVLTILEMGMERGSFLLSKSKINLEVMKKLLNIGTEIRVSIRDNIGSDEIEGEI